MMTKTELPEGGRMNVITVPIERIREVLKYAECIEVDDDYLEWDFTHSIDQDARRVKVLLGVKGTAEWFPFGTIITVHVESSADLRERADDIDDWVEKVTGGVA